MKRISTILDTIIQQTQSEQSDIGVTVVYIVDDGDGGFSRCVPLFGVYEVADLEIEGQVWTEVLGGTGLCYVALEGGWPRVHGEAVACCHARGGGFHSDSGGSG